MTQTTRSTLLTAFTLVTASAIFAQAPANDTRATAIALTAARGFCSPTAGDTGEATASGVTPACAPTTQTAPARDLWYTFIASQSEMTVYAEIDGGSNNQLRVEVTTDGGDLVDCAAFSYSEAVRRLEGLTVGETYFIQLSHTRPSDVNDLKVCAYETPACLPVGSVRTRNGQNWTIVTWQPEGTPPASGYRVVAVPRGGNPVNDTPVAEADIPRGDSTRVTIWNLQPGVAYDFYVQAVCSDTERSGFVRPTQNFTQEPAGAPGNDSLEAGDGPEILPSISSRCLESPGSTRFATTGDGEVGDCANAGPDVWYELNFIAPRYTFEVRSANGTTADLALEAYTYEFDEQNNLTPQRIACANTAGPGGGESLTVSEGQLPETNGRRRVRIRVISSDDAEADFTVCGYQVPGDPIDVPTVLDPDGCAPPVLASFDGTGAPGDFVDVLTEVGQVICSIENTEDLGQVAVAAYGHTGELRQLDDGGPRYADRNVAVVVERQPTAPVLARFYLSAADLLSLEQAALFPQNGRTLADELLAVARVPTTTCSETFPGSAFDVEFVSAGLYGTDAYFVDVRISGFSEFFFSSVDDPLPTAASGVAESSVARLAVAPNPATSRFTVTLPQKLGRPAQDYRVTLVDQMGRVVEEVLAKAGREHVGVSVAQLSVGIYLVHVVGMRDGRTGTARVLVP